MQITVQTGWGEGREERGATPLTCCVDWRSSGQGPPLNPWGELTVIWPGAPTDSLGVGPTPASFMLWTLAQWRRRYRNLFSPVHPILFWYFISFQLNSLCPSWLTCSSPWSANRPCTPASVYTTDSQPLPPKPNSTECRTSYYTSTTKRRLSCILWLQKFVRLRILPAWQLAPMV